MDPDSLVKLLIALFLVLLNGFFVAAEFSIVKVRYSQIQLKAAEGNKLAKQAEHIIKNLDSYLSATQLGITLASLALGWVGEATLHSVFDAMFASLGLEIPSSVVSTLSLILAFLIITVMHIVFGELVPKSIAIRKAEATTMAIALPLRFFYNLFKPFIWAMNGISNSFLRLIKIDPVSDHDIHSTEELQLLVKQSADGGEIQEENYEIIKNAFDFTDHSAKQIMVPRQNIVSIDISDSKEDIIDKILQSSYSRLPVYENTIDNVVGVFYSKEVIREYIKYKDDVDNFDLKKFLREPLFVVESKKISDILKTFQLKKQHIAIVIDEFGGTEGIITLEDILEELVGEIQDEEDEEEKIVQQLSENKFLVQATQNLEEINEHLPRELAISEEGDYNSLAGYILNKLSDIPQEGQQFELENYKFKILKMQNKSVELVELIYEEPKVNENSQEEIED